MCVCVRVCVCVCVCVCVSVCICYLVEYIYIKYLISTVIYTYINILLHYRNIHIIY